MWIGGAHIMPHLESVPNRTLSYNQGETRPDIFQYPICDNWCFIENGIQPFSIENRRCEPNEFL